MASWVENHPYKVYVDGTLERQCSNLLCAVRGLVALSWIGTHGPSWLTEEEKRQRWVEIGNPVEKVVPYEDCLRMI
jgi:hypothetical protein